LCLLHYFSLPLFYFTSPGKKPPTMSSRDPWPVSDFRCRAICFQNQTATRSGTASVMSAQKHSRCTCRATGRGLVPYGHPREDHTGSGVATAEARASGAELRGVAVWLTERVSLFFGKTFLSTLSIIDDNQYLVYGGCWPEGETNHSTALLLVSQLFLALHSASRRK
jgi:hypothetical protein